MDIFSLCLQVNGSKQLLCTRIKCALNQAQGTLSLNYTQGCQKFLQSSKLP